MAEQEAFLPDHPASLALRDDLCWSSDRIGELGDTWSVHPDAELEPWLWERVRLSESLLAADPTRQVSRYVLATPHLRLARFLGPRDHNGEFEAALAAGLPLSRAAVRAELHRTMFVQVLIGTLSRGPRRC